MKSTVEAWPLSAGTVAAAALAVAAPEIEPYLHSFAEHAS